MEGIQKRVYVVEVTGYGSPEKMGSELDIGLLHALHREFGEGFRVTPLEVELVFDAGAYDNDRSKSVYRVEGT